MKALRLIALGAVALAPLGVVAPALAQTYTLDPSHSQALFSYNHLGFSTTFGMFSGFEGTIEFDADNPETSSVSATIPASAILTGWEARDGHFQSGDFLNVAENDLVTFESTSIEVTGEDTALITGDLTVNGTTNSVVLDTTLNQVGPNPLNGNPWIGFDATTTVLRSDFGMGMFAPAVSDEVELRISIEAAQAE